MHTHTLNNKNKQYPLLLGHTNKNDATNAHADFCHLNIATLSCQIWPSPPLSSHHSHLISCPIFAISCHTKTMPNHISPCNVISNVCT